MAEKNNAVCSICGNPYYLCMSCRDSIKVNPWKVHCDTATHYQIYQVIHGYNTNVYTKDEAKMKLKNINLDDMNTFRLHIQEIIKDILKEDKSMVKNFEKVKPDREVETVVEEYIEVDNGADVDDVKVVEIVEDIAKPTVSRKRNYKMEAE